MNATNENLRILETWGWDELREADLAPFAEQGWLPGRVVRPGRGLWRMAVTVDGELQERDARLTGRALGRDEAPVAGDWVVWRDRGGTAQIGGVLQRRTCISRKAAGEAARQQVIAANVDVLFVVQALGKGRGFTPRGLERYLAMAWESGCLPVVVLNKSDLSEDPEGDRMDAEAVAAGVDLFLCSALADEGLDGLRAKLAPGLTAAFVGPSGVGKSSIINALAGSTLAATGDVRDDDARGRHTTTHRQLHLLPGGPLLLDTPGLRELQLWGDERTAGAAFPEIEEAAEQCRFRDCHHENEPGCAVHRALEEGRIEAARFDAWLELRKELVYLQSRRDERSRRAYGEKEVEVSKLIRRYKKGQSDW